MSPKKEMTENSIHTRAMLVDVDIRIWYAQKFDKKVTRKVNADLHAADDAGRYNKHLLTDKVFKSVINACNDARLRHYEQTLSWKDKGWRLLPSANYLQYCEIMRKARTAIEEKLEALLVVYDDLRDASVVRMGEMADVNDFPTGDEVRRKFGLSIEFAPLPATGDFRVDLPQAEREQIEKSIQDRVEESMRMAMNDAWYRLYDAVEHIQDRLGNPDNIFRDSLVEGTRELCDVLARLNVAKDEKLERMRKTVLEAIKHDPQTFRDNKNLRAETAKKAEDILKKMSGMFQMPE